MWSVMGRTQPGGPLGFGRDRLPADSRRTSGQPRVADVTIRQLTALG